MKVLKLFGRDCVGQESHGEITRPMANQTEKMERLRQVYCRLFKTVLSWKWMCLCSWIDNVPEMGAEGHGTEFWELTLALIPIAK